MAQNIGSTPPPIPWLTHPRFNILKRHFGHSPPSSPPPIGNRPEPTRNYVNGAYYPNWRIYKHEPPSCLQLNLISHVFYAFAFVKPNGSVYLSDEWADCQKEVDGAEGCLRSFQQLKSQYQHLKVILSIGGGGKGSEPFAVMAADPQARERFGITAREMVIKYGLDGIDIDWEHPCDSCQGQDYVHLLQALRRYLPPPYILTSALPAGEWALKHINLSAAHHSLDFINLMTYDFAGPWVEVSGHHSQLYTPRDIPKGISKTSCNSSVIYLINRGVPSHKIVLGIPAYGRSFLGCNDVGQKWIGQGGEDGTFEYKDLPRPGATEHVDMALGAAYCCGGDGGFVSYDNPQTVRQKSAYVKEHGLGGVFYWSGTTDQKSPNSLIEASFTSFHTR